MVYIVLLGLMSYLEWISTFSLIHHGSIPPSNLRPIQICPLSTLCISFLLKSLRRSRPLVATLAGLPGTILNIPSRPIPPFLSWYASAQPYRFVDLLHYLQFVLKLVHFYLQPVSIPRKPFPLLQWHLHDLVSGIFYILQTSFSLSQDFCKLHLGVCLFIDRLSALRVGPRAIGRGPIL